MGILSAYIPTIPAIFKEIERYSKFDPTGCFPPYTKTELMNNEFRNDILSAVFGDANVGFEIIEGFDEEFYDSL